MHSSCRNPRRDAIATLDYSITFLHRCLVEIDPSATVSLHQRPAMKIGRTVRSSAYAPECANLTEYWSRLFFYIYKKVYAPDDKLKMRAALSLCLWTSVAPEGMHAYKTLWVVKYKWQITILCPRLSRRSVFNPSFYSASDKWGQFNLRLQKLNWFSESHSNR